MVENFDLRYERIFDIADYMDRWNQLKIVFEQDYESYRVLFLVEILALIDKLREPTTEDLKHIFNHIKTGGVVAVKSGRVIDTLLVPVWPLELAQYDVMIFRTMMTSQMNRKFPLTAIKCGITALVQSWWAFETLINDFASIIREQRSDTLSITDIHILDEISISINKKGQLEQRSYYQSIESRIQFIYHLLTHTYIDRSSADWHNLMTLKDMRDSCVHRIGKTNDRYGLLEEDEILNGFTSIKNIISNIFGMTPEFS